MKCCHCNHCCPRADRYYCSKDRKWISNDNYYTLKTIACSENPNMKKVAVDYLILKVK